MVHYVSLICLFWKTRWKLTGHWVEHNLSNTWFVDLFVQLLKKKQHPTDLDSRPLAFLNRANIMGSSHRSKMFQNSKLKLACDSWSSHPSCLCWVVLKVSKSLAKPNSL